MDKKLFNKLKTILPQYTDNPSYDLKLLQRIEDYINNLETKLHKRNVQIKRLKAELEALRNPKIDCDNCKHCGEITCSGNRDGSYKCFEVRI